MQNLRTLEHADALGLGMMDIGAAARATGLSIKMIRYYESIRLLPRVARTLANYRIYGADQVNTLRFIKRARSLGFSMEEIRELVGLWQNKSRSSASVKRIAARHVEALNRKIDELKTMSDALKHLTHHCHGDSRPGCPILDDLASV
jgi:MerR family transcriptional regulator, copper efflux regulator